jgi:hypothetical protein
MHERDDTEESRITNPKNILIFVSLPNSNAILNSSDIAEVDPRDHMGDDSIRTCAAFVYSEKFLDYPFYIPYGSCDNLDFSIWTHHII